MQQSRDVLARVFPADTVVACLYCGEVDDDLRVIAEHSGVGVFVEDDFGGPAGFVQKRHFAQKLTNSAQKVRRQNTAASLQESGGRHEN